jgi:membrane protein required for colicin V production
MNWLDIVLLVTIALFTAFGLLRGLVQGIFAIVAIIAGIIAGVMFNDLAGEVFIKYDLVNNKPIASVAGFLIVMFGTYAIIHLIGWVITKIMGTLHLNWVDRIGGGALGLITGVAVAFFLLSVLGFFFPEKDPLFRNAILVPYVKQSFSMLQETLPEDFKDKLQKARKLVQEKGIKAGLKEADKIKEAFKE